jgi:hypothetical protein
LTIGETYIFKMRVQTDTDGAHRYWLKVWPASGTEPGGWTVEGTAPAGDQPLSQGSLLLVAHHVDASFGDITVQRHRWTQANFSSVSGFHWSRDHDPVWGSRQQRRPTPCRYVRRKR